MLSFQDVCFTYEKETVPTIDHLSFEVAQGEFVSIIGASGCGKSTIFRLINGTCTPSSGTIQVREQSIANQTGYAGYMPQRDLLFPWRTVHENMRLPLEITKQHSVQQMDTKVLEVLQRIGLAHVKDKRPSELSGGMRQRVAFGRTLLTGADLLLLDEPFSALDFLTRLSMREWLLAQWEQNRQTVLFVTHDVEEALMLSSRILVVPHWPIDHLLSFDVPSAYPRTPDCVDTPEMLALRQTILDILRPEVVV